MSYKFADFEAEAYEGREPTPPFVIDDVDPPISIESPAVLEVQIELSEMVGPNLEYDASDTRRILELMCGDAFPAVWELVRRKHPRVFNAMAGALLEHFRDDLQSWEETEKEGPKALPKGPARTSNRRARK